MPISSTFRSIASRTDTGSESNDLENVGDQTWSAAATDLLWLPSRELSGRNFAAGLVELSFYLVGQFKLVLKIIVNPFADCFDFLA